MSILDKIKSFEYDKNRNAIFGIKSAIIWGNMKDKNEMTPILYISKPKSISQEDFEIILDKLNIQIRK